MVLVAAGCGGDDDESSSSGGEGGELVFGTASDPVVLDGALVSDGESLRAIDQMFEGLVTLKPGTTEVVPGLAESWEADAAGTAWTFHLRERRQVPRRDRFNAEAVCYNFDRWYNFKGPFQEQSATYYWQTVFGGFSDKKTPSLYKSCEATDENTVVLNLTKASSSFLGALALTNFTIASPEALQAVRRGQGLGRRGDRFQADRHVRHRASDRHGPVQVRVLDPGRQARNGEERRLLGRQGQARQAHLPADRRQRGAPPGAPERRAPGLRPRRAPGRADDRGRERSAAPRPAGVQRRLRRPSTRR